MIKNPATRILLWTTLLLSSFLFTLLTDLARLEWVSRLSTEGSPAPALDAGSFTGYQQNQHHFLGGHERGATYRWISDTQQWLAHGLAASRVSNSDAPIEGRPVMLPRLEEAWISSVAWVLHMVTGDSVALCVERSALWEPVAGHLLVFLGVLLFGWRRFGFPSGCVGAVFFSMFPVFASQFLPGDLTSRTGALFLGAYVLASLLLPYGGVREKRLLSKRLVVASFFSLWLEPAIGAPVVLLSALTALAYVSTSRIHQNFLFWSVAGALLVTAAAVLDHVPWNVETSELRYLHPLYAVAWLGLGLAFDGFQRLLLTKRSYAPFFEILGGGTALVYFFYAHVHAGVAGCLHSNAAMSRIASLDETVVYRSLFHWWSEASPLETIVVSAPVILGLLTLGVEFFTQSRPPASKFRHWAPASVVVVGVFLLGCFSVRWLIVSAFLTLPIAATFASSLGNGARRSLGYVTLVVFFAVGMWNLMLPPSLKAPSGTTPPSQADLDALVFRQFAHWLRSHSPEAKVVALAPPELSDSLLFHGGVTCLMSTAWESFPGQIAASRILSAPEYSEAEAVVTNRGLTHLILPTWDHVLPRLVRAPDSADKEPLYARLRRWVFPPFLRPVPYHLPAAPGYDANWLLVYKITASQDEALSLSRLAEYYLEMGRDDLAALVLKVLLESYKDDPNAAVARASIYASQHKAAEFARELERICSDVSDGLVELSWDRRVQRAFVLALGRRPDLARSEIEKCLAIATPADPLELTPLQAFRLRSLLAKMDLKALGPAFDSSLAQLSSEFSAPPPSAR